MKKTLILMLSLISIFILVGCNKKLTTDGEKVTSEDLVKSIKEVHKESNIYYVKDKERLSIELTYKNTNAEEIYNQFKDDAKKIINDKLLLEYKQIQEVDLTPLVDKQTLGCSDLFKLENNKFILDKDHNINIKNIDSIKTGLDIINGKVDTNINIPEDTTNTKDNTNDVSVSVPQSGEFKPETLINDLDIGNTGLDHSTFEVKDNGDKKVISVDLLYKKDALVKGIVTKIQFLLERAFKDSGYDIDLCISQKHPIDLYRCKYADGSWSE
ncbi:Uncharacterised protein [[Clostridium] sordellii]|uniref:hypothetical protein n=1 Tax=Paraclostridium sordellii TaxID=1505 RepID=UPI0005E1430D|nr:hypothetical protein [Paeniclostridium sordellii]CEN74842.1 Uncharacterised protein [[Clostridium] sordellii] [Paeniclostridium sordellii]CEQ00333.1 Uncharacterised protein [[Clostridium] sordellii] [Paeniclostridium sordellii]